MDQFEKKFKFTKSSLAALPLPAKKGKRITYYDLEIPKLAIQVTSTGNKSFYVIKRTAEGVNWLRLGTFQNGQNQKPEMTPEQARTKATIALGEFAAGKNPAKAKRLGKSEMTLLDAFNYYIEDARSHAVRTVDDMVAAFERYLGKIKSTEKKLHGRPREKQAGGVDWENRKLSHIHQADVARLHKAIGDHGKKTTANRIIEILSATYNKAMKDNLFDGSNPCAGITAFKENKRDRFIGQHGDEEVKRFLEALNKDDCQDFQDFVWLSILTGARRGNVLAMRWSDIQAGDRWKIRSEEYKNDEEMIIPLGADAVEILDRRRQSKATDFVFPAKKKSSTGHMSPPKKRWEQLLDRDELAQLKHLLHAAANKPIANNEAAYQNRDASLARMLNDARAAAVELGIDTSTARLSRLTIHDLRRTLGSWQAITGSSLLMIGKTLGHKSSSATMLYARLNVDPVRRSVEIASGAFKNAGGIPQKDTDKNNEL
jgi:integrase